MKKGFKYYLGVWAVLLILFNVIAFVSPGWIAYDKYTTSFWIGYAFISISFIVQLACSITAFKAENLHKFFYNVPLIRISYTGLILSFFFGGLCMLISPLPYWIGIILCYIVLILNVFAIIKATAAGELVEEVDEKIKGQTMFIKHLTVDAESLISKATTDEAKEECRKVYEAIRYSDPMSHEALADLESQIRIKFSVFEHSVEFSDLEGVKAAANNVVALIEERNKKCKALK